MDTHQQQIAQQQIAPQPDTQPDTQPDWDLVKSKHRAMWALGDYPAVVRDLIASLGAVLVTESGVGPGHRVLDVAAGTGNAAVAAAMVGATVTASDLTPELLAAGSRAWSSQGLDLVWEEGDAEALPHDDEHFDIVLSCLGVMFAPRHAVAADELVRVTRPGGTIGLLNWTPTGFIGELFGVMKPFAPPAPVGAMPPPLWGDREHVEDLLGPRVRDVRHQRRRLRIDRFSTAAEVRDYLKATYGPTIATYRHLGEDRARVTALDGAMVELVERHLVVDDTGFATMDWEYSVLVAHRV